LKLVSKFKIETVNKVVIDLSTPNKTEMILKPGNRDRVESRVRFKVGFKRRNRKEQILEKYSEHDGRDTGQACGCLNVVSPTECGYNNNDDDEKIVRVTKRNFFRRVVRPTEC